LQEWATQRFAQIEGRVRHIQQCGAVEALPPAAQDGGPAAWRVIICGRTQTQTRART